MIIVWAVPKVQWVFLQVWNGPPHENATFRANLQVGRQTVGKEKLRKFGFFLRWSEYMLSLSRSLNMFENPFVFSPHQMYFSELCT